MKIKIKKHFLYYKRYKLKCAIGKSGITNNKKEGDLSTPEGVYKINTLYYRKDKIKKIKCEVKKKIIKKNMGWCDDVKSIKYNQEISFPFKHSAEKLYRKDKIKKFECKIKKKIIKKNMGWCDDVRSKKYNQEITFPYNYSAEKLYRKDSKYDLLFDIGYNKRPIIKGKGSAIFLHLSNKKYKATRGCIGILKKDFLKILPLIKKNTKILIN